MQLQQRRPIRFVISSTRINPWRSKQNGRHFLDTFKRILVNENYFNLLKIESKFVPHGSINIIDPDNGLTPVRRQAIMWTNDGLVYWFIYVSLGLGGLNIEGSLCKTVKPHN